MKKIENWVLHHTWVFGKRENSHSVTWVKSKDQLVDCLTKEGASFEKLCDVEIIISSIKKQKTQKQKKIKREKIMQ